MAKTFTIAVVLIMVIIGLLVVPYVHANDYDSITKELEDTKRVLELSSSATRTNEADLRNLNSRLASVATKISELEGLLDIKKGQIEDGEDLVADQKKLIRAYIYSNYKTLSKKNELLDLIFSDVASASNTHVAMSKKKLIARGSNVVGGLVASITSTKSEVERTEGETARLSALKSELARQSSFLAGEVKSAKDYQSKLISKITELSARQQSILAARSGSFSASAGDGLEYDDFNASREFSPGFSPAFAVFSIGAYTHRKGFSQYGAKGRADAGQSRDQILQAYFPGSNLEKRDNLPAQINVDGYGSLDLDGRYLYGLAEMPSSWPRAALEVQAIAARTYALRYIGYPDASRSICTTESCQVYSDGKAQNPPAAWREAVDATRGQVLLQNGSLAQTFYSSTTGGYLTSSGWDTDGASTDFLNNAWEKRAKSPWFYKSWYRESYSNSSNSCGRAHPWLNATEMADIINAAAVIKSGTQEEVDRVVPTTIGSCGLGGFAGNPYSHDELRSVAAKYGSGVANVSGVSYSFNKDQGTTASVTFSTDRGDIAISGSDFKTAFNLRAPGYISVKNVLYAVERK